MTCMGGLYLDCDATRDSFSTEVYKVVDRKTRIVTEIARSLMYSVNGGPKSREALTRAV